MEISRELISNIQLIPLTLIWLALTIGVLRRNKLIGVQKLLVWVVAVTAVVDLTNRIFFKIGMNNMPIFHFFTIIDFLLLSTIYKTRLNGTIENKWMNYIIVSFVIFSIVNILFFQGPLESNSNTRTVAAILLIAFSILYFYQLLKDVKYHQLESNPMFWINIGVLIYFSSSLVLHYSSSYLSSKSMQAFGAIYLLHAIFNIIYYIAYNIALWVKPVS